MLSQRASPRATVASMFEVESALEKISADHTHLIKGCLCTCEVCALLMQSVRLRVVLRRMHPVR